MKFLDLFAGIGGFRLGMESAGHECVGFCEIDKFARESYKAIHNTEGEVEMHDITTVSDEFVRGFGNIDIICGGFPCQAFSTAGRRLGFEDTRGTLFFEIARFASILRPRYLFLENVKGLLNHDGGATFETILRALDDLGYDVEWQVLNSKNFGVPQNRERVFIIGHSRGERTRGVFPFGTEIEESDPERKIEIVGNTKNPDVKRSYQGGNLEPKIRVKEATKDGYSEAEPGDTINLAHPNSKTRRGRVGKQVANTLLTGESKGVVVKGIYTKASKKFQKPPLDGLSRTLKANCHDAGVVFHGNEIRVRKLTPRECWRLQGFPDWAFDKASKVNSNSQLYKQAGNSVTVNVIEAIAKRL